VVERPSLPSPAPPHAASPSACVCGGPTPLAPLWETAEERIALGRLAEMSDHPAEAHLVRRAINAARLARFEELARQWHGAGKVGTVVVGT